MSNYYGGMPAQLRWDATWKFKFNGFLTVFLSRWDAMSYSIGGMPYRGEMLGVQYSGKMTVINLKKDCLSV